VSLIKSLQQARDPEARWRAHGWGPERRFPAEGPDGRKLAFSIRAPLDWRLVDVRRLADEGPPPAGSVAETMLNLREALDAAGVIAVLGIEHTVMREDKADAHLFATISVALADVPDPTPESVPGADPEPLEYSWDKRPYRGVRTRGTRTAELVPGRPAVSFLTVQYLIRCDYGVLATTFATPQREFERLTPLFDKITRSCHFERGRR
jgi:hypothetical protein